MSPARLILLATTLLWTAFPGTVVAQETRAEALRDEREEKQQQGLPEPDPNTFERVLSAVERGGVPLITRDGVYAKIGTLTTGSGTAFGAGYRSRRFLGRDYGFDAWAGGSLTAYWETEARLQVPVIGNGRLLLNVAGRYRDYPREDYFGLGPDSTRSSFADFRLRGPTVDVRADARVAGPVSIIGGAQYIHPLVSDGKDPSLPSISSVFDETTAPGLDSSAQLRARPRHHRRRLPPAAQRPPWRLVPRRVQSFRRPRRAGLLLRAARHRPAPVRRACCRNAASSSRARIVSTSEPSSGQTVPFYLMPTLGGNETLRGFRAYRFRGPHAMLLQGEYRFEILVRARRRALLRRRARWR